MTTTKPTSAVTLLAEVATELLQLHWEDEPIDLSLGSDDHALIEKAKAALRAYHKELRDNLK